MKGWHGVDFDGTLVTYEGWQGAQHIGEPVVPMIHRVTEWLVNGEEVRIFTARVYAPPDNAHLQEQAAKSMLAIQEWCRQHLGKVLPVTCTKDFGMIDLWDDRCVQVVPNTGEPIGENNEGFFDRVARTNETLGNSKS